MKVEEGYRKIAKAYPSRYLLIDGSLFSASKKKSKKKKSKKKKDRTPTNPELWQRAIAAAKRKFDVYPSAYANGWAVQWYNKKGGGWRGKKPIK